METPTMIPHPWHGVKLTDNNFKTVYAYIEMTPNDSIKFELDKESGLLKIDRPQKFSNICPCLYGFLPQTYSGNLSGKHSSQRINKPGILGDKDPVDICILTDKNIAQGNILAEVIVIGGIRIIDSGEADDKIIAILKDDLTYGNYQEISEVSQQKLNAIQHYFLTYKATPEDIIKSNPPKIEIHDIYSKAEAIEVIKLSYQDYKDNFSS